ncbi:phosphate transport system permease protein [Nocardioides thalensis]|uniref:Phosphate transport system permease protein PstA n=1 Tax=Nocardioides thalensis TaxID=1914755 RepID=A0A853C9L9_9ACTN|nr:phosphate ABC transporter permease PstA [Nocardioides thalensis]NYJ02913.1 phosphate transport system permease protein [Nocardioides thalensis]
MSAAATTARAVTSSTIATGKSKDRDVKSLVFLGALWFSLFFGVMVLIALIVDTVIDGSGRFDSSLFTHYTQSFAADKADELAAAGRDPKDLSVEYTGFRAGILGSVVLMMTTALLAIPLGVAAATYLEEFADNNTWYNRVIEVNLQNLAAVPAVIYGMLAAAIMSFLSVERTWAIGGAVALALLILPVVIITTREALRSVPEEIRQGSLALGATVWQTTWRQTLPSAIPGISTGTILGLSRAIGEAAPLVMVGFAAANWDPEFPFVFSSIEAFPLEIFQAASSPLAVVREAASAGIIVLLAMILGMNALAIIIRNKFQRSW